MTSFNKLKYYISVVITFFFITTGSFLGANEINSISVNKNTTTINLYRYIELLEDVNGQLTINDVVQNSYSKEFQPASILGNSFGFTKSVYWVRFSVQVDESVSDSIYLEFQFPLLDYVDLYIKNNHGVYERKKSGEQVEFSNKDIFYRNPLFKLANNKNNTYYMRLQSEGSMQIPLQLWTSSAFIEHVDKTNLLLGLYYGNMLLLMLIAFTVYLKINDKIFLNYSVYLFTYLIFQLSLNGFLHQYVLPSLPLISNMLTGTSVGLVIIGALIFSGNFLQILKDKSDYVKLLYYGMMIMAFLGIFVTNFLNYSLGVTMLAVTGVLLPPILIIGAIKSLINGYKPAKYFLIAWAVFLFGIFAVGLVYLGLLPHNFFTVHSMQIGSTFEVLLLGYALVYRLNILNKKKDQATLQANHYLNQLNQGLESLVAERTQELEEKNKLLNELAIRDSMTGMLNHNASIEKLSSMKSAAKRYGYSLSVVMIDIDFFKVINDKYGHPIGDIVIKEIASILKQSIRQSDSCGRYGGEEFILLLHDTDGYSAFELAERTRKNILSLTIPEIQNHKISASFGIDTFDKLNPDADMIKHSDYALYSAKKEGRNNVVLFSKSIIT